MSQRKVIVDVDVGLDDYMALLLLFHAEKLGDIKIQAIICTDGNTARENVCRNVVRMLETLKRIDIPVYRGALKALIPAKINFNPKHGLDGFGDLQYDSDPDLSIIKEEPAALAIRSMILNSPGEITLICIAALTNLALALRIDDEICSKIKDLWIMGGNYTAVGSVTSTAEFNFYKDPEAAFMVLESITQPIYILTYEAAIGTKISRKWRDEVLSHRTEPIIELLNRAEEQLHKVIIRTDWTPCDAFLVAAFLYPEKIIARSNLYNASVELHGSQTRGQVVLDHRKAKPTNAVIIEKVNEENFKELIGKFTI